MRLKCASHLQSADLALSFIGMRSLDIFETHIAITGVSVILLILFENTNRLKEPN